MVDAFREELAELGPDDVTTLARLGVRLRADVAAGFAERLSTIVNELYAADDPDGEPFGFFVAAHRRRDDAPARKTGDRARGGTAT